MATSQHSWGAPASQPNLSTPHIPATPPARPRVFVIQPPNGLKQTLNPSRRPMLDEDAPLEHTPGHRDCPACAGRSFVRNERALADMTFPDAYRKWLSARTTKEHPDANIRYVTPETIRTYEDYFRALGKFFSEVTIAEIHDGHLRTYQEWRSMNYEHRWARRSGQNRIRKEIGLLIRIMKAAGTWGEDMRSFQQLPVTLSEMRRALSADEQARLLQVMAKRDDWLWVYYYTVLALRTCASTCELRGLRLKDIDLEHRTIRIGPEASKNKFRNRTIPLIAEDTLEAIRWLMSRARRMGATEAEHYLFPFGVGHSHIEKPDPARPMSKYNISQYFQPIRAKAGLPHLRPYDLRHTAITRMAEAGIPIATIMSFAGHISQKMSEHYTTISMQAKREAADVLASVHESMSLEGGAW